MAELMFVEIVRRHFEQLPPQHSGWLAGLKDDVAGPALAQLHERPAQPWTLAELARAIASSRTVLSDRFSQIVGVSPMLYLTRWRHLRKRGRPHTSVTSRTLHRSRACLIQRHRSKKRASPRSSHTVAGWIERRCSMSW
ncbi:MAG: helix-turn-helix transcriptional regulator [Gemmatimonadaceae bacterium]|nr:helix-turn-helix transcriptional regulator [Gemmatimonadaceae bacterium]